MTQKTLSTFGDTAPTLTPTDETSPSDQPNDSQIEACDLCGDERPVNGELDGAIERGGRILCADCCGTPVAFEAFCRSCGWRHLVEDEDTEFGRDRARTRVQQERNTHESTYEHICIGPAHDADWREIEPEEVAEEDHPVYLTHIDADGLYIPPQLRGFTSQIVFRTPRATIQMFGTDGLGPYYPLIDKSHFGDPEEILDARNPELAPDRMTIKPQGEEPVEFVVEWGEEVSLQ